MECRSKSMIILFPFLAGSCLVSYPIDAACMESHLRAVVIVYLPLSSVSVPRSVPFRRTVANGIGSCVRESLTTPVTVTLSACTFIGFAIRMNMMVRKRICNRKILIKILF